MRVSGWRCAGRFAGWIAFVLMTICPLPALSEDDPDLRAFLATYHCALVDVIERIHADPNFDDQDRFIILNPTIWGSSYVQCALEQADRRAFCEAASGFFASPGDAPNLSPSGLRALARLGFSTDGSQGNFQQYLHFPSGLDTAELARFLLTALQAGFGVRADMTIEVSAPLVMPDGILPRNRCPPTS